MEKKNLLETYAQTLPELFRELSAEGFANVSRSSGKALSYSPVGSEVSVKESENVSVDVTIIKNGRKAVVRMQSEDPEEVTAAVREIAKRLPFVSEDGDVSVPDVSDQLSVDDRVFDFDAVGSKNLVSEWEKVRDFKYPKNVQIEAFSIDCGISERLFVNSHGAVKRHRHTSSSWGIECFLPSGDEGDVWYDSFSSDSLLAVDAEKLSDITERLLKMSAPVKADFESGIHTVAFEGGVFADFLDLLCDSATAENIRQKTSFFDLATLSKPIMPQGFSVVSKTRYPGSAYGRAFDGEGTNSADLPIVTDGRLENLFTDSKNAKKLSIPYTGNPSPANLVFEGPRDENALKKAKFLFTNLMAFHTVDTISGKFALEGEGFLIENGKPAGYVKNVAVSGNAKTVYENLLSTFGKTKNHGNVVCGDVLVGGLTILP